MCNEAIGTYPSTMQLVTKCYKARETCHKAVYTCAFVFDSFPDWYLTQKICYKVVFKERFVLKYCLKSFKTKEMCNKAVNSYLLALKFFSDWFVTSNIIGYLYNALFSNDGIAFDDTDFNINTLRDSNTVIS